MSAVVYNKLIRDRVPDLIRADGREPITRPLEQPEYASALRQKLSEEVGEFLDSDDPRELADILEVVFALGLQLGLDAEALEDLRGAKSRERGSFEQRLLLVEIR